MNIGIDISQIVYKGSGVARFTEGLVNAVLKYDTDNSWTFVFFGFRQQPDPQLIEAIQESRHRLIRRPVPPSLLSIMHNTLHRGTSKITFTGIPLASMDWFITSDWTEPQLPCKKATIVHDLVFKRYPETVHRRIRDTQEDRLKWLATESRLIFTDSQATASDLKQHYQVKDEAIMVNYPGINFETFQPKNINTFKELQQSHSIPDTYILSVGKLEPRKNIPRLLEAYKNIPTDTKLVIVGMDGWGDAPRTNDKRVLFAGYLPDDELLTLYQHAQGFVYPSLYEGFGYPVVEAMRNGCPVLTSNTSSLAEIAKDAALLCDPEDTESIRRGLTQLLSDEPLRAELIQKGRQRAAHFTWERYYKTMISALAGNGRIIGI